MPAQTEIMMLSKIVSSALTQVTIADNIKS